VTIGEHKFLAVGPSIVAVKIVDIVKTKDGANIYKIEQVIHDSIPEMVEADSLFDTTKDAAKKALDTMGIT
jgi:hypothetical protein